MSSWSGPNLLETFRYIWVPRLSDDVALDFRCTGRNGWEMGYGKGREGGRGGGRTKGEGPPAGTDSK